MFGLTSIPSLEGFGGFEDLAAGSSVYADPLPLVSDFKIPARWQAKLEIWVEKTLAIISENLHVDSDMYVKSLLELVEPEIKKFEFRANLIKPFTLTPEQYECMCAHVCSHVYDKHVESGMRLFPVDPPIEQLPASMLIDFYKHSLEIRHDNMRYLRFATSYAMDYFKANVEFFLNY